MNIKEMYIKESISLEDKLHRRPTGEEVYNRCRDRLASLADYYKDEAKYDECNYGEEE